MDNQPQFLNGVNDGEEEEQQPQQQQLRLPALQEESDEEQQEEQDGEMYGVPFEGQVDEVRNFVEPRPFMRGSNENSPGERQPSHLEVRPDISPEYRRGSNCVGRMPNLQPYVESLSEKEKNRIMHERLQSINKTKAFNSPETSKSTTSFFKELRKENRLLDGTFVTNDGVEFRVHRSVHY